MGSNGCDEGGAGLVRDATFFPAGHVLTRTCACACTCTRVQYGLPRVQASKSMNCKKVLSYFRKVQSTSTFVRKDIPSYETVVRRYESNNLLHTKLHMHGSTEVLSYESTFVLPEVRTVRKYESTSVAYTVHKVRQYFRTKVLSKVLSYEGTK